MFIQLLSSATHGFNQYVIFLLITINLLPVTMCYSLRPIWLNPSSASASSSSDYIDTQQLLDSINDLKLSASSEIDSTDDIELNSLNTNTDNLLTNDLDTKRNNLNQFKSSSILSNINDNNQPVLIQPWIESEIISTSIGTGGTGTRRILLDPSTVTPTGSGHESGNKKRSESRVKKALSLFTWTPNSYKQHLDDAYSSELVSAVSRGHGRTVGHSLRWG